MVQEMRASHRCELYRFGTTLYVAMPGITPFQALWSAKEAVARNARLAKTEKVLFDYRRSVLTLNEVDWRALQRAARTGINYLDIRVGMLGNPAQRGVLWDHCRKMLDLGYTRLLFTDEDKALAWAGMGGTPQVLALASSPAA